MSIRYSELSPPEAAPARERVVVIAAGATGGRRYLAELWCARELALMFVWRDLSVRYKQTAIGVAWAWLRPLATTLILTFVFSRVAGLKSAAPYALTALCGVWAWFLFSGLLSDASNSLINNAGLVTKVYFPRLILPLAAAGVALIDFCVQGAMVAVAFVGFGWRPAPLALASPLFALWAVAAALGPGIALAALNVRYRDVRYIVPFLVQFGLYASPVGFESGAVPAAWRWLFELNPVAGAIEGLRWSLLGGENPFPACLPGLALTAALLVASFVYFRAAERAFADTI